MQQESPPPPNNLFIEYFVTMLPDKWNILTWGIHFGNDGEVFKGHGNQTGMRWQFVVTRFTSDGFAEGFPINVN